MSESDRLFKLLDAALPQSGHSSERFYGWPLIVGFSLVTTTNMLFIILHAFI